MNAKEDSGEMNKKRKQISLLIKKRKHFEIENEDNKIKFRFLIRPSLYQKFGFVLKYIEDNNDL